MDHLRERPLGHKLALAGCLIAIVGMAGPWMVGTVQAGGFEVGGTVSGFDIGEAIVLVLLPSVVALLFLAAPGDGLVLDDGATERTVVPAVLMLVALLYALVTLSDALGRNVSGGGLSAGVDPGWGLIVSLIGTLLGVGGAVYGGTELGVVEGEAEDEPSS